MLQLDCVLQLDPTELRRHAILISLSLAQLLEHLIVLNFCLVSLDPVLRILLEEVDTLVADQQDTEVSVGAFKVLHLVLQTLSFKLIFHQVLPVPRDIGVEKPGWSSTLTRLVQNLHGGLIVKLEAVGDEVIARALPLLNLLDYAKLFAQGAILSLQIIATFSVPSLLPDCLHEQGVVEKSILDNLLLVFLLIQGLSEHEREHGAIMRVRQD